MRKLTILLGLVAISAATPANAGVWSWFWLLCHPVSHGDPHHCDPHDPHHC